MNGFTLISMPENDFAIFTRKCMNFASAIKPAIGFEVFLVEAGVFFDAEISFEIPNVDYVLVGLQA